MSNPKSLKPYPKGVSGNPAGRPKNPPEINALRKMTKGELELLVHKILLADPSQLKGFNSTVLELWLASGASKAIQQGDYGRLNILLDRLYGKAIDKDSLQFNPNMDKRKMLEHAKEAIKLLEEDIKNEESQLQTIEVKQTNEEKVQDGKASEKL